MNKNVDIYSNNIDNQKDINIAKESETSYNSPIIPKGFKTVETDSASWKKNEEGIVKGWNNGLVIEDEVGNQFVWIPVKNIDEFTFKEGYFGGEEQNYLIECDESDNTEKGTEESKAMYESVKKYQGFYISRFEAGMINEKNLSIINGTIKPVSKKGSFVLNVPWGSAYGLAFDNVLGSEKGDGAVKLARSMYPNTKRLVTYSLPDDSKNETGVISTLCYGVQWDAVMNFLSDVENPYTNTKYIKDSTKMGWYVYQSKEELKLSGTSLENDINCTKNIYDLAGNIDEWTMESYKNHYRVVRGGEFLMADIKPSASMRNHQISNDTAGFRVALYIKNKD